MIPGIGQGIEGDVHARADQVARGLGPGEGQNQVRAFGDAGLAQGDAEIILVIVNADLAGDIDQAGNLGDVVALCDCDDNSLQPKLKKWPNARSFYDYRKFFDEMNRRYAPENVKYDVVDSFGKLMEVVK